MIRPVHLVVGLGASIMQGQVSSNFLDRLSHRMGSDGYRFLNQGMAGYTAEDVFAHLDEVFHLQPDAVLVLVGTNDVTATVDPTLAQLARFRKRDPAAYSLREYRQTMRQIVRTIHAQTPAVVGLLSLPVLGENLDDLPNQRIREYNAVLHTVADQEHATYLPVFERQEDYLIQQQGRAGRPYPGGILPSIKLLFRLYLLRQNFATISARNGFRLLTDGLHLNHGGAAFIVEEIERFLRAQACK